MIKKDTPPLFGTFSDFILISEDQSISAVLIKTSDYLKQTSDSARLDAELLLAHCLHKQRSYLHTWPEKIVSNSELESFIRLIEKRVDDYPVAYLLGRKSFWTFDLTVTPDVLIPRPETELLVDTALEKLNGIEYPKVLDLGTGSGAIAIALASERKDATVFASDFSASALSVAKQNAFDLNIKNIEFLESDWFTNILENNFDLIVSNPPYIDPDNLHLLGTIRHEPRCALVANNKGMEDIEKIVQKSRQFLKQGGWLMIEHGYDQKDTLFNLFNSESFKNINNLTDLNELSRITMGNSRFN